MEPSRVWKNLLSGKQAVPTVACPSCGAQVPEFRIHSHLDTCLTNLPSEEEAGVVVAAADEVAHELSDGEQNRHRRGRARGQGRGRGRERKRKEGAEIKKGRDGNTDGRKRARGGNVEGDKGLDAPVLSDGDDADGANFYQHWEYSVSGFDELAKSRKAVLLSDLQKQELLASGVLTIERHEVSAMVLDLDHLLADTEGTADVSTKSIPRFRNGNGFHISALNQVGVSQEQISCSSARMSTANGERHDGTQSEQGKALEAWWEQWVMVEWPEGSPQRSRAAQEVCTDTEKVGMERSAAQETTLMNAHHAVPSKPMSTLNYNESRGVIGGNTVVMPHLDVSTTELFTKSDGRGAIEVGVTSRLKISNDGETRSTVIATEVPHGLAPRGEQFIQSKPSSHSKPNIEHSAVAESSARKAGPPSPSTAPANNPADISGASPGLQACPICNNSFPPNSSNRDINKHIDECLNDMAGFLD